MPKIEQELNAKLNIRYLSAALHVDYTKLKNEIVSGLECWENTENVLLYGSMCHPDLPELMNCYNSGCLQAGNCIDIFIREDKKREFEKAGNTFFLTGGYLCYWREIFCEGTKWDSIDARINMGRYQQVIMLDTGAYEIKDEDLLEFSDYIQKPIDIVTVDLEYFTENVLEICKRMMAAQSTKCEVLGA